MWDAVEALALRGPTLRELRQHRLQLIAAYARRRRGEPLPPELRAEMRRSVAAALAAPLLLERVRAACDGPLVLMKGPEVAARYPDSALRPYKDLDVLTDDPWSVQRALLAAGFVPTGDPRLYEGIHHLRPLALPGLPLTIEVHARLKWPERMAAPATGELLEAARPAACNVEGVLALAPAHHAVVLAAHAWAHDPLGCAGRLVDVAAVAGEADRADMEALARRWRCRRLWRTTRASVEALFSDGRAPLALSAWARHLSAARERTVLETHVTRLAGQAWGMPARTAGPAVAGAVAGTAARSSDERWGEKLRRTRMAVADAFVARSEHEARFERRRA